MFYFFHTTDLQKCNENNTFSSDSVLTEHELSILLVFTCEFMLAYGHWRLFNAVILPGIPGSDFGYFEIRQPFDGQMGHSTFNIQRRFLYFVRACYGVEQLRKGRAVRTPRAIAPGLGFKNLPFDFNWHSAPPIKCALSTWTAHLKK